MEHKFQYTSAIAKIRQMKSRKKIIQGGTSAGKTWAVLPILINKAASEPNLEISVVSESIPHLRRGALKDFLKVMKMTGRFIQDHYNKTHLKYTFSNGSYIEFFSVDDESKLRGARRNILYVNEANNVKYDAYLQLAIRTSDDIYIDFNPTHKFWAHTEVLREEDSELVILNYLDNEALPESIKRELEANRDKAATSDYWKNWWTVYGEGKIGVLEGVIFDSWDEINTVPEEATLIGYGLDFGYTNDPTALVAVYKYNESLIFDELLYEKELTNSEIANKMKQLGVRGDIFADSAEPKSIKELSRYGFRILAAKKGKDSINFGINLLQQFPMLITKRSTNLKAEILRYSWRKDREGNTTNMPIDGWNHLIDAMRYLAIMKLKKRVSGKTFKIM